MARFLSAILILSSFSSVALAQGFGGGAPSGGYGGYPSGGGYGSYGGYPSGEGYGGYGGYPSGRGYGGYPYGRGYGTYKEPRSDENSINWGTASETPNFGYPTLPDVDTNPGITSVVPDFELLSPKIAQPPATTLRPHEAINIDSYKDIIDLTRNDFTPNEKFPWETFTTNCDTCEIIPGGPGGTRPKSCPACMEIPGGPGGSPPTGGSGAPSPPLYFDPVAYSNRYREEAGNNLADCALPADFTSIIKVLYDDIISLLKDKNEEIRNFQKFMPTECAKKQLLYLTRVKEKLAKA